MADRIHRFVPTLGPDKTLTDAVLTDAVNAAAAPTQAEFNALVARLNTLHAVLRSAGIAK